jgi:hypothetical protein
MRRSKKNKQSNFPQTGGAAVGSPGVQQHYNEAKPQLTNPSYGQPPPGVNDTYNQQTYNQQGYTQVPTSPTPQYQQPYGGPNVPPPQQQPYGAPSSPTQNQSAYAPQDSKFGYTAQQPQHPNAVELGGVSTPAGGQHTAELPSPGGTRGT